jgi:arginyl-tRNA synthetase
VFGASESSLIKLLKEYPEVVLEAARKYKPSHIANYLIKVCQAYNEFYQNCPIIKEKDDVKDARLLLCDATSKIIKDGLELLDIEVLEEM